jgi:hypothetical protein
MDRPQERGQEDGEQELQGDERPQVGHSAERVSYPSPWGTLSVSAAKRPPAG